MLYYMVKKTFQNSDTAIWHVEYSVVPCTTCDGLQCLTHTITTLSLKRLVLPQIFFLNWPLVSTMVTFTSCVCLLQLIMFFVKQEASKKSSSTAPNCGNWARQRMTVSMVWKGPWVNSYQLTWGNIRANLLEMNGNRFCSWGLISYLLSELRSDWSLLSFFFTWSGNDCVPLFFF